MGRGLQAHTADPPGNLPPAVHVAFLPIVAPVTTDTATPERETEGQELSCRKSGAGVGVPGVTFSFSFSVFLHLIVLLPLFSSVFPLRISHYLCLSFFVSLLVYLSLSPCHTCSLLLCLYVPLCLSMSPPCLFFSLSPSWRLPLALQPDPSSPEPGPESPNLGPSLPCLPHVGAKASQKGSLIPGGHKQGSESLEGCGEKHRLDLGPPTAVAQAGHY